jgi:hypothetical protein
MARGALRRRVVLLVAGNTIRHLERADLHNLLHLRDVAVARGARDARLYVRIVLKPRVIRQTVHKLPVDGLLLIPGHPHFLDLGLALAHRLVAIHAQLYIRQTGRHAACRSAVAERAVQPGCLDVDAVIERDGLCRWCGWLRSQQARGRNRHEEYSACQHARRQQDERESSPQRKRR